MSAAVVSALLLFQSAEKAAAADSQSVSGSNPDSLQLVQNTTEQDVSFKDWLEDLKAEARQKGISESVLSTAFGKEQPIERVLELDRRQPEFTLTLARYFSLAVTDSRIKKGRALLAKHRPLLEDVARRYGVQPRFLVAFWGLETNFGSNFGNFPVPQSLATLAHDPRRADFFRAELLHALGILDSGDIAVDKMEGSWAGAMGHLQFMPSTFVAYATDGDGDGKRDIWGSLPDVFSSAANYLSSIGWKDDETWGREVRLPDDFDWSLLSISTLPETRKTLAEWQALGVRKAGGQALPDVDIKGAIVAPAGHKGPAFMVYDNYRRIMHWNRSILYALAIGHLSDRLVGKPALVATIDSKEPRLSRQQVKELQAALGAKGFDAGTPDGRVGPNTRKAIRAYQVSAGLPADAYPSLSLLQHLQQ
ncbi:lytic murein transglycosylase [Rhodovibrionaceae bacterium A322]